MEDVPRSYRKAFSSAFSLVLRRYQQASTMEEETRALK